MICFILVKNNNKKISYYYYYLKCSELCNAQLYYAEKALRVKSIK